MSAKHQGTSLIVGTVAAFVGGFVLAVGAAAGFAALMASRGLVHPVVWPFATIAVCVGSLFGGYVMARTRKSNGLVCGAVQGALFAVLLLAIELLEGNMPDTPQTIRLALIFLCGCVGGCLGVLRAEKVRRSH